MLEWCCFRKHWTLTRQIMCSWFLLSLSVVAITLAIAIPIIYSLGSTASDSAQSALSSQTQSNLLMSANASALVITRRFTVLQQSVLRVLQRSAKQMFEPNYNAIAQTNYWHFDSTTLPSDIAVDNTRQAGASVSLTHSSMYATNATKTDVTASGYFSAEATFAIERSAMLDLQLAALYAEHTDIISLFCGFDAAGLYRLFPGQTVPQVSTDPTYDARVQAWYQAAQSASGAMIITDPFYDEVRDLWLVTMSVSLTDSSDTSFGVVGITVATTSIRSQASSKTFLSSGYTAVIQLAELNGVSRTHLVIAHPKWSGNTTSLASAGATAAPTLTEVDSIIPSSAIVLDGTGVGKYSVGGAIYYVAHAQFLNNYMVLTIAPQSEAFVTTASLDDEIKTDTGIVVGVTVGLCALTLLVTLIVAYCTARSMIRPMKAVEKTANNVTSSRSLGDKSGSSNYRELDECDERHDRDEIGRLVRGFQETVAGVDKSDRASSAGGRYPVNRFHNSTEVPWKRGPAILTPSRSTPTPTNVQGAPGSLPFPVGGTSRGSSSSVSSRSGAGVSSSEVKLDDIRSPTSTTVGGYPASSPRIESTMEPYGDGQRIRFITSPSANMSSQLRPL